MGKCTSCGAALDPGWKFCVTCGTAVVATEAARGDEAATATSTSTAIPEPIPAVIRPITEFDDEPVQRRRPDLAVIVGVIMALGGGVLIIVVAIALFSPKG
ncbi:zinc-ribbon domain-containing protein [Lacisediminihabitans sp. FW035]